MNHNTQTSALVSISAANHLVPVILICANMVKTAGQCPLESFTPTYRHCMFGSDKGQGNRLNLLKVRKQTRQEKMSAPRLPSPILLKAADYSCKLWCRGNCVSATALPLAATDGQPGAGSREPWRPPGYRAGGQFDSADPALRRMVSDATTAGSTQNE